MLILITKKQGIYTISTMIFNTVVYAVGFHFYLKGGNMIKICNIMVFCFTFGTILLFKRISQANAGGSLLNSLCIYGYYGNISFYYVFVWRRGLFFYGISGKRGKSRRNV